MKSRTAGFTLIELLVVIGVIGLLVGLLMPAIMYARNSARRTQCQSNLHQIGIALDQYLDAKGIQGRYPDAAMLPSLTTDRPSLKKVLGAYAEDSEEIFMCPQDEHYYPREGLSYEYPASRLAKKTRVQALVDGRGDPRSSSQLWVLYDFDSFHGTPGDEGSRNFLYADGHVGAL